MSQSGIEIQYVTFSLGEEAFAVPVSSVREILDHQETFKIPHGPECLLGLLNVRGQGVPVIDLRLRLGMSRTVKTPFTRILVIDVPLKDRVITLGLMADSVYEVVPFKNSEIEGAPDIGVTWGSDYIHGVIRRNAGFVVIIDLQQLFSDADSLLGPVQMHASAA